MTRSFGFEVAGLGISEARQFPAPQPGIVDELRAFARARLRLQEERLNFRGKLRAQGQIEARMDTGKNIV